MPVLLVCSSLFAQPIITSFAPSSGPAGSTVVITGSNFSGGTFNNIVYIGGVRAYVSAASPNSISATVPRGAAFQPISITNAGLTAYSSIPFIVTFKGGGAPITKATFPGRVDSATGLNPIEEIVIDLDGDGKPDITTVNNANSPVSTISVLRNTSSEGAVSFSPKSDFSAPAGSLPQNITVADLNGDGQPDLIITTLNCATGISVFMNRSSVGNLSFTRSDFGAGIAPNAIAVGDIDGDGKPDLVASAIFSGAVSIFKNISSVGRISFSEKIDLQTAIGPEGVAVGDLDGDNKPDIVVANSLSGSYSIFRNQSKGNSISFQARVDVPTGKDAPNKILIGDIDGDEKPDVLLSYSNQNTLTPASSSLSVFRNISSVGTIAFSSKENYGAGDAYSISLGDLNGDGKPEVLLPTSSGISLYQNQSSPGDINLSVPVNLSFFSAFQALTGDLDGDTKPDIAVANFITSAVTILRNETNVPGITSFSPDTAGTGTVVKILGKNFIGVKGVNFGGVPASSFSVVSSGLLTAIPGVGASGDIVITTTDGTATIGSFTYAPLPVVSSFVPTAATTNQIVTITGANFTGRTAVTFGGMPAASFTINSPSSISAVVGTGSSGEIAVTTLGGTGSLAGFNFTGPVINSFNPASGGVGTVVSVTGTNFSGATAVSFGGIPATSFTVNSSMNISAIVGPGETGIIAVTTPGGTGTKTGFTHTRPVISSFSPSLAGQGTLITITGSNFTGVTDVSFGGTAATSFTVNSSSQITAEVGPGASGKVAVTSATGTGTAAGFSFTTASILSAFSPVQGPVGSSVTLMGSNFSSSPDDNVVFFGAVRAKVTTASRNALTVIVPTGATFQPISVTTKGVTAYASQPFIVTYYAGILTPTSFSIKTDFPLTTVAYSATIGDLDGDGKPDLAAMDYESPGVSLLKNTSTTGIVSFADRIDSPMNGRVARNVIAADLDGDGKPDLALLGNGLFVSRNTGGNGAFAFSKTQTLATVTALPGYFSVGDLDGDGKPDIVVTNSNGAMFSLFRNTSTPGVISFADRVDSIKVDTPWESYDGSSPYILVGDMDADGRPDLAVAFPSANDGLVMILKNTSTIGNISFGPAIKYTTNAHPSFMKLADLNGDGMPELVAVNFNAFSVSVFKNTGRRGLISFARNIEFGAGEGTRSVAVDDLDGDGKPDLAVVNAISNTVSVLKNTSIGDDLSFAPKIDYATGSFPQHVSIGDLDGDGKPDLAVVNYSGSISVLRNSIGELSFRSFYPSVGSNTTLVTLTGTNFTGATAVSFGGTPAASFTVTSPTTITAKVGNGTSGIVSLTTPEGTVSLPGFSFFPIPFITPWNDTSFCQGDTLLLTSSSTTGNSQWFNGSDSIKGATSRTLTVVKSGMYAVRTIVDGVASLHSGSVSVTVRTKPTKPVINRNTDSTLISSALSGNQWFADTLAALTGAVLQTYQPDTTGHYSVKVTTDGCSSVFADIYLYVKLPPATTVDSTHQVRIAPNPSKDFIRVSWEARDVIYVVAQVFNFNGKMLLEKLNIQNGETVNISGLPPGVYTLKVFSTDGKVNSAILFMKL